MDDTLDNHDPETDEEDLDSSEESSSEFRMEISMLTDDEGYLGRECPVDSCEGYFKITIGTGLSGTNECHCPYCGHVADFNQFYTQDQVEYIQSIVLNHFVSDALAKLKQHEFNYPARGPFGIGISLTVEGNPPPIHQYREKELETHVVCANCTLRYAVYGVFGYCPDCGVHNSLQILDKNLELAEKEAGLAQGRDSELSARLIELALQSEVSAFDSFGRETCRVQSARATHPDRARRLSFQNLVGARRNVQQYFGVDIAGVLTPDDWDFACRCFQKRHLLAHKMGVVDEEYVRLANDPSAIVGRKVVISIDEVNHLAAILRDLGRYLIEKISPTSRTMTDGTQT